MITLATQAGAERYLVGRTIASVETQRVQLNGHTSKYPSEALHVSRIHFTDGSSSTLSTAEMDSEYATLVHFFGAAK